MKKGFTLIEMLVVVLIIGILAGIALPQYQSAVRKARVVEAKLALRAIGDAAYRWYLQNDNGFDSLEDLDIGVSTESEYWDIYVDDCTGEGCAVNADPKKEGDYYIRYYGNGYDDAADLIGRFACLARNDNGKKICKQLGGTERAGQDGYQFFI